VNILALPTTTLEVYHIMRRKIFWESTINIISAAIAFKDFRFYAS